MSKSVRLSTAAAVGKVAKLSTERRRARFSHDVIGMQVERDGTVKVSQWVADILVAGIAPKAAESFGEAFRRAARIARKLRDER